jgi:hypothetical protein
MRPTRPESHNAGPHRRQGGKMNAVSPSTQMRIDYAVKLLRAIEAAVEADSAGKNVIVRERINNAVRLYAAAMAEGSR